MEFVCDTHNLPLKGEPRWFDEKLDRWVVDVTWLYCEQDIFTDKPTCSNTWVFVV